MSVPMTTDKYLWNIDQISDSPRRTERIFSSPKDESYYCLICSILEQAVLDWRFLDCGETKARLIDAKYVYAHEVEDFFRSEWFEELLSYALPDYTPREIREELNIKEPERRN